MQTTTYLREVTAEELIMKANAGESVIGFCVGPMTEDEITRTTISLAKNERMMKLADLIKEASDLRETLLMFKSNIKTPISSFCFDVDLQIINYEKEVNGLKKELTKFHTWLQR